MYERRERKESALRRSNRVSLKQFAFIYMCRHRIVTKFCIDSIKIEFSSFENNRLQRVSILQFLERTFGVVPVRSLFPLIHNFWGFDSQNMTVRLTRLRNTIV